MVALKTDGTVVRWGYTYAGSTAIPSTLNNVKFIYSNSAAYVALTNDNNIFGLGLNSYGGSVPSGVNNVKVVYSTCCAFAALKMDGTVTAWG